MNALRFLPALALAFVATTAWAGSTYPGANCLATSGTATFDTDAHAENASSSATLYLVCPVVDPDVTTPSTTAAVWVTDLHYSSNVCCDARVKNTGSSVSVSSQVCSTGSASTYQGLAPTPPSMSYTFTHRYYYCSVPATYSGNRSEIRTYRY